jgi:hypothetical protein
LKPFPYFVSIALMVSLFVFSCKKTDSDPSLIYQSNFAVDDGKWADAKCPFCQFYQGKYQVESWGYNRINFALVPIGNISGNYSMIVECSLALDDSTKTGYTGMLYNGADPNNYRIFYYSNRGYFNMYQWYQGKTTTLQDWTFSNAIHKGMNATNILEIRQYDKSIDFLINKVAVASLKNSHEFNFRLGLASGTQVDPNLATNVTGTFDNLLITKIN